MKENFDSDYTIESESNYINNHEHIVDVESPEIKARIEKAKELFGAYFEKHQGDFKFKENVDNPDLIDDSTMEKILKDAEEMGIYTEAEKMRELIFGKNMSLYGVEYFSNACGENCSFCPMGQNTIKLMDNSVRIKEIKQALEKDQNLEALQIEIKKLNAENEAIKEKITTLTPDAAKDDLDSLSKIGHQTVCLLSGEAIARDLKKTVQYAQLAADNPQFKEIVLNMGSFTEEGFRYINENLKRSPETKLQHRVFQETYDRESYAKALIRGRAEGKQDFDKRYNSQVAALRAGFDDVGIGVLFGLSDNPLKELLELQKHVEFIKKNAGKEPKRCALLFANSPEGSDVEIPHNVGGSKYRKDIMVLVYALAALATPTVSRVNSERDDSETLKELDKTSNHTTLFVHPTPGGNVIALQELQNKSKIKDNLTPQAAVEPRWPEEAIEDWKKRGYNILNFNVKKYIKK